MVARAARHDTGFPPNVLAWLPLGQSMTVLLAMIAPSGIPLAIPFAEHTMSGSTSASHSSTRPSRALRELTFQVAMRTRAT